MLLLAEKQVLYPHNIAFSIEKKMISSESGEKYAQIKHHLQAKTVLTNMFDVRGQQRTDFYYVTLHLH